MAQVKRLAIGLTAGGVVLAGGLIVRPEDLASLSALAAAAALTGTGAYLQAAVQAERTRPHFDGLDRGRRSRLLS